MCSGFTAVAPLTITACFSHWEIHSRTAQADSRNGYSYSMTCNAFVLGGGGVLGAAEVGMARALLEAGIRPDLVCGTSIGAINGAAIAADPTPEGAKAVVGDLGRPSRGWRP